jgi:hypothetical protein
MLVPQLPETGASWDFSLSQAKMELLLIVRPGGIDKMATSVSSPCFSGCNVHIEHLQSLEVAGCDSAGLRHDIPCF